jgi:hypothetical protein
MAPALQSTSKVAAFFALPAFTGEVSWGTQATWRHGHFGLKSAPSHRDFRPGKDGLIK